MPTSTFNLADNADDGFGITNTVTPSIPVFAGVDFAGVYNYAPYGKWVSFLRFSGITIPQGSTINSAVLNFHAHTMSVMRIAVKVDGREAPTVPAIGDDIVSPPSTIGQVTGSDYLYTPPPASSITTAGYSPASVDLTSLIQTLVNTYDYSSGAMMFYLDTPGPWARAMIYQRNFGSTKDAELVIDFTPGAASTISKVNNIDWNA